MKKPLLPRRGVPSDMILHIVSTGGLIATIVLVLVGWRYGIFDSQATFSNFMMQLGWLAIPAFIAIQAVQVIIPILPAAIGCSVGVIVFGPVWGFVYNYVGICIGSIIAFLLARSYGLPLVRRMVPQKQYEKYNGWLTRGKAFDRFFAIAIFAPVAPDDLLCYLAGLTPMSLRKFTAIILLGKPFAIFLYSAGLTALVTFFWH
ncbi:TVP38/TMEM64 family protein [Intestinibacillus massiliensis]|nr:TVP38/TMEM64 family protein [Intestinibacillus massiliensis]